jgi:hypothetical protein
MRALINLLRMRLQANWKFDGVLNFNSASLCVPLRRSAFLCVALRSSAVILLYHTLTAESHQRYAERRREDLQSKPLPEILAQTGTTLIQLRALLDRRFHT